MPLWTRVTAFSWTSFVLRWCPPVVGKYYHVKALCCVQMSKHVFKDVFYLKQRVIAQSLAMTSNVQPSNLYSQKDFHFGCMFVTALLSLRRIFMCGVMCVMAFGPVSWSVVQSCSFRPVGKQNGNSLRGDPTGLQDPASWSQPEASQTWVDFSLSMW
ncbi:hypothetical protein CAPTEDRAFT_217106 [Capitella teleta]|uniref:Uncharacterized protein n=1 Tax=Capitella teleta TaxID=283909 RepID=R7TFE3_CAPTE|nr:hypothetical protein CAPTEDRAFT_217106 [Capitella teleta]|eukprot:ELT92464.1 hypothetical protein CAPTEDRAFT_217106 [Capitella teleta]